MDYKKLVKLMDEKYTLLEENASFDEIDFWIRGGIQNIRLLRKLMRIYSSLSEIYNINCCILHTLQL